MARETLKDFLKKDPYGASTSTEKIDYIVDQGGDGSSDPYSDDLKKDLKEALGRFSHHVTAKGIDSNRYAISEDTAEFSLREDDGTPSAYTSGDGGEEMRFLRDASGGSATVTDPDAQTYFQKISGGGDPKTREGGTFSAGQLGDVIDKTGKNQNMLGNSTLDKAAQLDLISPVLVAANRFDPGKNTPYAGHGETLSNSQIDSLKFASKQGKLGEYNEDSADVKLKEMRGIAENLLVMATGHTPSSGGPPAWLGVTKEQLLPSLAQLGSSKIDRADMYAKNRASPGFGGGNADTYGVMTQEDGYRTKSYGALNSPLEPFSAIPKMGMTTMSIALVIVIQILVDIVAGIMSMLTGSPLGSTSQADRNMRGVAIPAPLGSHGAAPDALILKPSVFGVKHNADGTAIQDYSEAVEIGIEVFFGETSIRPKAGGLLAGLPGGKNINDSPGYYAIIFRAVIRSTIEIGLKIGEIFKGGLFAILGGIADLLDTIKNSKLMAYMNMLASLGDIYREVVEELGTGTLELDLTDGSTIVGGISKLSAMKLREGSQHLRVGKSRYEAGLSPYDDTLVWGTGQLPSTYLFAGKVGEMARLGALSEEPATKFVPIRWHSRAYASQFSESDSDGSKLHSTNHSRLSSSVVKDTEDFLDGEYVPFYFHDLRTNEIIAFHAFLTSLTDSYSVSYDQTKSYGRADPVMVYNGTGRTIGMTFMVVATNPTDFDEMWWKINKLVTLLYPQYSPGTLLSYGADNQKITAPFSQIPTASPLIRLRLGDLLKSNYSKFSLARLFGLGDHDPASKDYDADLTSPSIDPNLDSTLMETATDPPLFGAIDTQFVTKEAMTVLASHSGGKYRKLRLPAGIHLKVNATVMSIESLSAAFAAGDIMKMAKYGAAKLTLTDPVTSAQKKFMRRTNVQKFNDVKQRMERRDLDVDSILIPYMMLQKSWIFDLTNVGESDASDEDIATADPNSVVPGLMAAASNPIVRAFETTRGKGLAGVITQMDFQWLDNTTWITSTPGSNAPRACSITFSFQPMHDIAPGIDHNGFNRAPVYNVGPTANTWGGDPYDE